MVWTSIAHTCTSSTFSRSFAHAGQDWKKCDGRAVTLRRGLIKLVLVLVLFVFLGIHADVSVTEHVVFMSPINISILQNDSVPKLPSSSVAFQTSKT